MLTEIELQFSDNQELILPTEGITIFVGPNNSGKSLVLKEIELAFSSSPTPSGFRLLRDFHISWFDPGDVDKVLEKYRPLQRPNMPEGHVVLGRIDSNGQFLGTEVDRAAIVGQAETHNSKSWWASQILRWGLIRLDGRSRFDLTNDQEAGDLLEAPVSVLAQLFSDDEARKKVRDLLHDAFKVYFTIDATLSGKLRIRLSDTAPGTEEQSLNAAARKFHGQATHIKDASDGVQAYCGILTAVLSGDYHTTLIDEPEAFLHPPLARKLGKQLATIAREKRGNLLASTHSADFLMGCLQGSKDVRVVRLEYSGKKSRGRSIDPLQLRKFFEHPLMRSANVIAGLFYDGVVVTESDNDRAFYSEIYHRLTDSDEDWPSILFINAQNKQTITEIIKPLRQFGVPAAAIVDIDVIKEGGTVWTAWVNAIDLPTALRTSWGQARADVNKLFIDSGKDMKRGGGIEILSGQNKVAAGSLFSDLAKRGVFVVQRGELEHWLPKLLAAGQKTDWTIDILQKLGSDPAADTYVKPSDDDVWAFIRKVVDWIKDPNRQGV